MININVVSNWKHKRFTKIKRNSFFRKSSESYQVKVVRLQDKLGKQNFHEDMKKVFEPVTKSFKDLSEEVAKAITETSNKNYKALEKLNNKLLEIVNDRVS